MAPGVADPARVPSASAAAAPAVRRQQAREALPPACQPSPPHLGPRNPNALPRAPA